jgi:Zn-dependent peptidase ImmA (M78 family)
MATLAKAIAAISDGAQERRVSRPMLAYRLLQAGIISKAMWSELSAHFEKEWQASQKDRAEKQRASDGGPNYYVVRRHRVGPALLGLVRRSLDEGNVSYTKAGRVLGVKPRNVQPLLYAEMTRGVR